MATDFTLPELGEGIDVAVVTQVLVSEGDHVDVDQPVLEVEAGKATIEVPSPVAGTVDKIHVKEDEEVTVGQVLLSISSAEDGGETEQKNAPVREKKKDEEGTEEEPPRKPQPQKPEAADTDAVKEDNVREGTSQELEKQGAGTASRDTLTERPPSLTVPAAPSVRRFAREIGVDIGRVPGGGHAGRVSIDDVKRYAKELHETLDTHTAAGRPALPPLPDFGRWGGVDRVNMSPINRRTAEHMALCWDRIPHVTQFDRADITELDQLRKKFAEKAEKAGGKLTITPMLVKVVASALKVFPKFNTSVDIDNRQVLYKSYCNIGVAVDTERGLLVPVIKDVDRKNMLEIARELGELADKARMGKLRPDQMEGATFTVTNLGSIGGTHFTPIINWPEVAILGVGRASEEPCLRSADGVCRPRLLLPLSLSYDHRVIDGADGARFIRWVVAAIEEPLLLSLEG